MTDDGHSDVKITDSTTGATHIISSKSLRQGSTDIQGAVPVGALEELVETWMRQQEAYPNSPGGKHASSAVRCCADELQEVIDEYGGTDD